MNCDYCGAALAENSRFCLCCGTKCENKPDSRKETAAPEWEAPLWEDTAEPERPEQMAQSLSLWLDTAPELKLPVGRSLAKMALLGIVTLGIYPVVVWCRMVTELNITSSREDGRRTMPYFAMVLLAPLTLGILPLVWMHRFCDRVGSALLRRGIDYRFGPRDFWLWNVLGSLILVGPFVFTHKLTKAVNQINGDFNARG